MLESKEGQNSKDNYIYAVKTKNNTVSTSKGDIVLKKLKEISSTMEVILKLIKATLSPEISKIQENASDVASTYSKNPLQDVEPSNS